MDAVRPPCVVADVDARTRRTRPQRKEAKKAAIGRLLQAARCADARALQAETLNVELQARLLERQDGSEDGREGLADQIADRLTSIAPRLKVLLEEDDDVSTARRNIALHNAASGESISEMGGQQVKRLQRGARRQKQHRQVQVQHFSIDDSGPCNRDAAAADAADAIMTLPRRVSDLESIVVHPTGDEAIFHDSFSETSSDDACSMDTVGTRQQLDDGHTLSDYNISKVPTLALGGHAGDHGAYFLDDDTA